MTDNYKPSLDFWKFLVHIMLKPSMQDFKHDLTSMGDECNCPMVTPEFSSVLLFFISCLSNSKAINWQNLLPKLKKISLEFLGTVRVLPFRLIPES